MFIINPPVIAHRGASMHAPENTLAAFRAVSASGAKWVEFDVMLAQCGEVVVIHDETLERTTNGIGRVSDHPWHYLRTLDAGSWFSAAYAGEPIPRLIEVLAVLQVEGLSANIEIKCQDSQAHETVRRVAAIMQAWSAETHLLNIMFSSFSMVALECVRQMLPDYPIGMGLHTFRPNWEQDFLRLGCESLHVNHALLTAETASRLKLTADALFAYTVNCPERALELLGFGVDALFSDCPENILPALHLVQSS